jgi:hypothetical protein
MEIPEVGSKIVIHGRVDFDGKKNDARMLYLTAKISGNPGEEETVAVNLASLKKPLHPLPEDIRNNNVTVGGIYAGEVSDPAISDSRKIKLINASYLLLQV